MFVDGFKTEREFIAAEWPFSHTAANFWSMIYDHDVAAVVVLNNPPSKLLVVKNYIDFWPQVLQQFNCYLLIVYSFNFFHPFFNTIPLHFQMIVDKRNYSSFFHYSILTSWSVLATIHFKLSMSFQSN